MIHSILTRRCIHLTSRPSKPITLARCLLACINNSTQQIRPYSQRQLDKTTRNLIRNIESEIKTQENLIKESKLSASKQTASRDAKEEDDVYESDVQSMDIADVMQIHGAFLKEGGWEVRDLNGSSAVEMVCKDPSSDAEIRVRFDVQQVIAGSGESDSYKEESVVVKDEEEDFEDEEEMEQDEDAFDDDSEMSSAETFPLDILIKRPGASKNVLIQATAEAEGGDGGRLEVMQISLLPDSPVVVSEALTPETCPYEGPDYQTLDPDLRQSIDSFINEKLNSEGLIPFVLEYSHAKESKEYLNWLQQIKQAFAPSA